MPKYRRWSSKMQSLNPQIKLARPKNLYTNRIAYNKANNIEFNNKLMTKKIIFIIETSNKIYELLTYKEVISDLFYACQCKDTIKKKFQNLDNYHIEEYDQLILYQRVIRSK